MTTFYACLIIAGLGAAGLYIWEDLVKLRRRRQEYEAELDATDGDLDDWWAR